MNHFLRKNWQILVGIILAFLLIIGLVSFSINNHNISESTTKKNYRLSIAMVNEDTGGSFNNKKYNFGKNFINLATQDNANDWTVTSRSMAENGLKHNRYEMMIVVPNNFTEKTLQLESTAPQQADLKYKLNISKNPAIGLQAEKETNKLLQTFKIRVVNMYFSSIINNLHLAQNNVGNIVSQEGSLNGKLGYQVNKPLSELNPQFDAIGEHSKFLKSNYANWKDQTEKFDNETIAAMTSMVKSNQEGVTSLVAYNASLAKMMRENIKMVADYASASQDKQKELLDTYHKKMLANNDVAQKAYQTQYDKGLEEYTVLKDTSTEILDDFNSKTSASYGLLLESNTNLNSLLGHLQDSRKAQKDDVKAQILELQKELKTLRATLTGFKDKDGDGSSTDPGKGGSTDPGKGKGDDNSTDNKSKTPTPTPDDIRAHLKSEILDKINIQNPALNEVPQVSHKAQNIIEKNIDNAVKQVPEKSNTMVTWLKYFNNISDDNAIKKQNDISLINKYAKDNHIKNGQRAKDKTFDTTIDELVGKASVKTQNSIFLPTGDLKKGQVLINKIDTPSNLSIDKHKLVEDTKKQLNAKNFSVSYDTNKLSIKALTDTDTASINIKPQFGINSHVTPSSIFDSDPIEDVNYATQIINSSDTKNADDGQQTKSVDKDNLVAVVDTKELKNQANQKLDVLVKRLDNIEKTSTLINNYYGSTTNNDSNQLKVSDKQKLDKQAKPDSLYHLLKDTTSGTDLAEKKVTEVPEKDIDSAIALVEAMEKQIAKLTEFVDDESDKTKEDKENYDALLNAIKEQNDAISVQMSDTKELYDDAIKKISDLNYSPKEELVLDQEKLKLDLVKAPELVEDKTSGENLANAFQDKLTESKSLVEDTKANANKISDITPELAALTQDTNLLKTNSKAVINNTNNLANQWAGNISNNTKYSNNFNNVLKNTKNGQADNQAVYDYLADPLKFKNEGEIKAKTSIMPYYLTLIIIFTSIFSAYVLAFLERKRKITVLDKFTNTNNIFWKNTPWAILILTTGILEGLLIGFVSKPMLANLYIPNFTWILIIMALQVVSILIATYLLRQFKTLGMFILIFFTVMYLFFTPSLQIKVLSGTITNFITTISPFSHFENLIANLTKGVGLSALGTSVLVFFLIVGIMINLLVSNKFFILNSKETPNEANETNEAIEE